MGFGEKVQIRRNKKKGCAGLRNETQTSTLLDSTYMRSDLVEFCYRFETSHENVILSVHFL